ncbi:MAG: hypothetical protein PHS80_00100 [Methanothrix sp.]|nr:hypothetical protein [Methanothrix sp.]
MDYEGINNPEDRQKCSGDAFRFHKSYKAIPRMLFSTISKAFSLVKTPDDWLNGITGNIGVIRDIYRDEYLTHEKQEGRKNVVSSSLPFGLSILFYDPNYAEVANWFIYRICQEYEAGSFTFAPTHVIPDCWYQDGRGRAMPDYQDAMRIIQEQTEKYKEDKA